MPESKAEFDHLKDVLTKTLGLDWLGMSGQPDGLEIADDCAKALWDAGFRFVRTPNFECRVCDYTSDEYGDTHWHPELRASPTEPVGGVGTGAGEGATGQGTGTAWVTRSTDCPEAPAQAHPLDEPTPCGAEECPNCTSEYVDCPDGCQTCDNWYAEMVGRPSKGRYVVWFANDVDESGNVRPVAISDPVEIPSPDLMGYHGSYRPAVRRWAIGAQSTEPVCQRHPIAPKGRCPWCDAEASENRKPPGVTE